jgi:hypothetical protein
VICILRSQPRGLGTRRCSVSARSSRLGTTCPDSRLRPRTSAVLKWLRQPDSGHVLPVGPVAKVPGFDGSGSRGRPRQRNPGARATACGCRPQFRGSRASAGHQRGRGLRALPSAHHERRARDPRQRRSEIAWLLRNLRVDPTETTRRVFWLRPGCGRRLDLLRFADLRSLNHGDLSSARASGSLGVRGSNPLSSTISSSRS